MTVSEDLGATLDSALGEASMHRPACERRTHPLGRAPGRWAGAWSRPGRGGDGGRRPERPAASDRRLRDTGYEIWSVVSRKPMAAGLTLNREARALTSESAAAECLTIEAGMSRLAANSLAARSARQS